jgi:hypothetical protein
MSNFLEDPRLRQRWNQISHNAEAVTENAAAGIWNFQHNYINPCLGAVARSFDSCTAPCFGDREERARRRRERERLRGRAEYSFDFYDDWYADDESGGLLGGWSNEDWDRLLAGTGSPRRGPSGEVSDQPRRKRGMSYGKLPWKIGGTLRYKPSAADLQDHPGRHDDDHHEHDELAGDTEPLLGTDSEDEFYYQPRRPAQTRKRSGTAGSGDTSDSYRSRGDLFPSDGEGDEDAVPLDDDEFTVALDKVVDDRGSTRTRSSKGKRRAAEGAAGRSISRTVSRTTIGSAQTRPSLRQRRSSQSVHTTPNIPVVASMEDLQQEELRISREEDEEVERKRRAAGALAAERGLGVGDGEEEVAVIPEDKADLEPLDGAAELPMDDDEVGPLPGEDTDEVKVSAADEDPGPAQPEPEDRKASGAFVPARLPSFS